MTARTLAEIMDGEIAPFFPGGPDAFMAWSGDGAHFIEVIKRGRALRYGAEQAEYQQGDGYRAPLDRVSPGDLCRSSGLRDRRDRPARGWQARPADRGGYFHLVEVWVDGAFLIEFLDPAAELCGKLGDGVKKARNGVGDEPPESPRRSVTP